LRRPQSPKGMAAEGAGAGAGAATADGVNTVVDGLPFIEKGNELKTLGNGWFKAKNYNEAIGFYERAIAVLDKADGHPMLRQEVEDIIQLKVSLYNNSAQCLLSLELYRRVIDAATSCLKLDERNAKGLHRRAQAYESLRLWRKALADQTKLKEVGGGTLKPEDVDAKLAFLQGKVREEEKAKEEESSEDECDTALVKCKERFDEVVEKYDLRDGEAAGEVADWIVSGEWLLTTKRVAERWKMEIEDAEAFLKWIARGVEFQQQNADAQAQAEAMAPAMEVN